MTNLKTQIYKGRDGWQAETMTPTDANGNAWQITTHKGRGGVTCSAIQGQCEGTMFSYDMFGGKRLELAAMAGQCNEKKVREVHSLGLAEFERVQGSPTVAPVPSYVVGVGQIIFTDFINGRDESRRVIYEVTSPGHFKTVTLDGKELHRDDRVKPYAEKFGIGVYYNEGEILPLNEVNKLVESATLATNEREAAQRQAAEKAAAEGRFLCNELEAEAETEEQPAFEKVEVQAGEVQIIEYSAKAIAVIGDTKPIKDKLKKLGGRFNFRLSCGAGWIFPKSNLPNV